MYKALYRKWRPKTFDDVVGQEYVTETLKNEIKSQRISHAYLFTGSRGTGKTSCAKIFAKAVNCLKPENGNPCRECEICKGIEDNKILDIVEIDAASNNGVENIRTMREEVVFSPTKSKYRVYIVDEVHMLSTGAFNAFLKVLEEPPPHVIFILATTEINKLPLTILSRCQRFDFHRISKEKIEKRIDYICSEENIKIDSESLKIISNSADGAMRDALSILDQCSNACDKNIDESSLKQILGISSTDYLLKIYNFVSSGNSKECIKIVNDMYKESKNMSHLCVELLKYFRDLMVFKITQKSDNPLIKSLQSVDMDLDKILYSLDTLQEAYKNIGAGVQQKIEVEIALVKLCENNIKYQRDFSTVKNEDYTVKKTEDEKAHIIESESKNNFSQWNKILENLEKQTSLKSLYISLKGSKAYIDKDYILIDSKSDLAFEFLRQSESRAEIKKIVKDITGKQYKLGPYRKEENKKDPLDKLVQTAELNGVNVKIN